MGMDVYGLKPKSKVGEYFRNNVWWWHPLWDYCCFVDNSLIEKVPNAHCNDGDGLNAIDSRKLGFLIKATVEDGSAEDYILSYNQYLESLPEEPCHCIKSTSNISTSLESLLNSILQNQPQTKTQFVLETYPQVSSSTYSSLEESYDPTGPVPFPQNSTPSEKLDAQPNPDCNRCSGSGKVENFTKNYHINLENIQSFANFLLDCGGFQIC